eukprot:759732-Hanusia_phi.AAC.6
MSVSGYSPIPVLFRISIENLMPTQWYFSYYGMTYDIADEFMKSVSPHSCCCLCRRPVSLPALQAVIDFVTSFPATFNGVRAVCARPQTAQLTSCARPSFPPM